jgi:allophanate hydrolase
MTIEALHAAYGQGLDPVAVVEAAYRQLAAVDDPGIFITLLPIAASRAAAAALGPFDPIAKPLWGVPFAVKDNIDVAGLPTTAACPGFAYTAGATAPAVTRLLASGAILVGKTNLDQFATGLVGVRTPYPVPRNALNPDWIPGGSSSGSAVAVAHGIVAFALGTDTAGSGRVPAGLNNVVGLKPSLGSVSSRGMVPACRSLDTISVFAGTVTDADRVYRSIIGYDRDDPWSRPLPVPPMPSAPPPGLRLGVPDAGSRRFHGDDQAETAFDEGLARLASSMEPGAGPAAEIDMGPLFAVAELLYAGPWVAERYQAVRALIETAPEQFHPATLAVVEAARAHTAADAFAGFYRLAELRREAERIWERVDVLAVPTYPRPRTLADLASDPFGPNSELGTYTNFVNLLDWCALAVPGPQRSDGWPSGITLLAPRGQDGLVAALGARLHAAAGVAIGAGSAPVPAAPEGPARARAEEIELAVVGAHLSGLPLNGELAAAGGRFLRESRTQPDYRLYALAGGSPRRPGLLRVAAGTGAAIATEVWTLPSDGFGRFVAGVPSPLGIGTLNLADGTTPKGFLVETEGLVSAEDISTFGGWRAFLASAR